MVQAIEQLNLAVALKDALLDAYDPEAIILFYRGTERLLPGQNRFQRETEMS
jgi:hypothetical protein